MDPHSNEEYDENGLLIGPAARNGDDPEQNIVDPASNGTDPPEDPRRPRDGRVRENNDMNDYADLLNRQNENHQRELLDVQRRLTEAEDQAHQFHQQLTHERQAAAARNRVQPNDDGQQGSRGILNNRPPRNQGLADMNLPGAVPVLPNLAQVNQGNQQNLGGRRNQPPPNVVPPGGAAGLPQGAAAAGQGGGYVPLPPAPVNPGLVANQPPAAALPAAPAPVAAPVGDWGQNRTFVMVPNPTMATILGQVGDIGAVGLQILRILRSQANDPQMIADVDNLANYLRPVVTASDATRERERTSVELQPLTKTPTSWGTNNKIANIRLHHVPNFTGTSSDTIDIHSWLDRVFNTATSHTLSQEATINLMIMASTGTAADYIRQMRDERKTALEVVQALELRYGDLCLPEEAASRCSTMMRKDNQKLVDFIDRLRKMAKMANRNISDEEHRMERTDALIKGNIRRVLSVSLRNTLDEESSQNGMAGNVL
jgi:hypothetical protein